MAKDILSTMFHVKKFQKRDWLAVFIVPIADESQILRRLKPVISSRTASCLIPYKCRAAYQNIKKMNIKIIRHVIRATSGFYIAVSGSILVSVIRSFLVGYQQYQPIHRQTNVSEVQNSVMYRPIR